jgi:hypothetical protein
LEGVGNRITRNFIISVPYTSAATISTGQIKDDEVGTRGRNDKCLQNISLKPEDRGHSGDLGVEKRIILKVFFKKQSMRM